MSIATRAVQASSYHCFSLPNWDVIQNRVKLHVFLLAALLTEPALKTHEFYRRLYVVDALHPNAYRVSNWVRKFFLVTCMAVCAATALVTTLPGAALRGLAASIERQPYIYLKGNAPSKITPYFNFLNPFTFLSWNVCCIGGGNAIIHGGVVPWPDRVDAIADKIDADVVCLQEVFHPEVAMRLCEKLKAKGYRHFYFNIGALAFGASSGLFVASRGYELQNFTFTRFPSDCVSGTSRWSSKGFVAFDVCNGAQSMGRVFATHLQYSEVPQIPQAHEIASRAKQMQLIMDKVSQVKNKMVIVTGDLNMDDRELDSFSWRQHFSKGYLEYGPLRTWGGDAFCAKILGHAGSEPLNLDHTLVLNQSVHYLKTKLIDPLYQANYFSSKALSDHAGLLSTIVP